MTSFVPPNAVAVTPSSRRSRLAQRLTAAAALGRFELQVCARCEAIQYPPREACSQCLSDALPWRIQSGAGELLSRTVLHHSHDPYFHARVPWYVGTVKLDGGPSVLVHLAANAPLPPARVWVRARLDRGGSGVLVASEKEDGADLATAPKLRELSSDPTGAQVLVTDGRSIHSQALVRAFAAAGAARIWVGLATSGESIAVPEGLRGLPQVTCLRFDVTDPVCVGLAASAVASEIDILVNTADVVHDQQRVGNTDVARSEMETHYFGLLNLARHFGPPMSGRAMSGRRMCPAWVNVLSVFALRSGTALESYSASMAAANSLSQSLRAQLREAGVRLVTVYPGPLDEYRGQALQLATLSPSAFAKSMVDALRAGVEQVFPGDVAQEWLQEELDRRSSHHLPPRAIGKNK